jgi:hypothetical protein
MLNPNRSQFQAETRELTAVVRSSELSMRCDGFPEPWIKYTLKLIEAAFLTGELAEIESRDRRLVFPDGGAA